MSTLLGKTLGHVTKNNLWWKLYEMYRTAWKLCFLIPTLLHWVCGFRSNAQNNATSSTKMLVNCSQPFPIRMFPNMSFLCKSKHFTQFLMKLFLNRSLPSSPRDLEPVMMTFLCRSAHFTQCLAKKRCKLTTPHSHEKWKLVNVTFLHRTGSFLQFLKKQFWGILTPTPSLLQWGWRVWCPANKLEWYNVTILSTQVPGIANIAVFSFLGVILA